MLSIKEIGDIVLNEIDLSVEIDNVKNKKQRNFNDDIEDIQVFVEENTKK